jgi:5'-methylthioadenosine phosphorylase
MERNLLRWIRGKERRGADVADAEIGVIGGTGLYRAEDLEEAREISLETPFGSPSGAYMVGRWRGRRVAFLSRHGKGHVLSPTEINFRANLYGFKRLGVTRIVSASAVGSLREEIHPMDVVVPDQFFDRTRQRPQTFFGGGFVAHVSMADPTCPEIRSVLLAACGKKGSTAHDGGTYVCIEGPQFSTRAESHFFRSLGASVIGMTNLPEARLAREAEICYATLALVTDYDCWHQSEEAVTVEAVLEYLKRNAETARRVIATTVETMPEGASCSCGTALENAIITDRGAIPPETRSRLGLLVERHLK